MQFIICFLFQSGFSINLHFLLINEALLETSSTLFSIIINLFDFFLIF